MIIDGIKYIREDEIKTKKYKDYFVTDECNICAIVKIFEDEPIVLVETDEKGESKDMVYVRADLLIFEHGDKIIVYNKKELWGIYSKKMFDKAKAVIRLWGSEVKEYLIGSKNSPIILTDDSMGVIIAPRIDDEIYNMYQFNNIKGGAKQCQ